MLAENFTFTQQTLQDYVDCPYRFYLREIKRLEWPALESEPVREQEALMLLGTRFHLLCQQYLSGVPVNLLNGQVTDLRLAEWWKNFLELKIKPSSSDQAVERLYSIPMGGFRLSAKFDLVVRSGSGEVVIYDWKTSQHQPKRQTILSRMQSKVYPLMVTLAKVFQPAVPEVVRMIYWYPAFPQTPIEFQYSSSLLESDRSDIEALIKRIDNTPDNDFKKTDNEKKCKYCRYRSFCDRGSAAGIIDAEFDPDEFSNAFDLDFDAL